MLIFTAALLIVLLFICTILGAVVFFGMRMARSHAAQPSALPAVGAHGIGVGPPVTDPGAPDSYDAAPHAGGFGYDAADAAVSAGVAGGYDYGSTGGSYDFGGFSGGGDFGGGGGGGDAGGGE